MIKKLIKKFTSSEFNRNSLTLISGTTLAQLLPIAVSPILTRIYSPEDFGVLALFTSIVMIFTIIGNGRYELAIVLPKKDSYAINIWALTLYIAAFISGVLLVLMLIFHDFFVKILNNPNIAGWIYLAPFIVFFTSVFNSLNYLNTREKKFKQIAIVKIIRSGVIAILQLGLYFVGSGFTALISGYSSGQFASAAGFGVGMRKRKELIKKINKPTMIAMAKRYKRFPQFTMIGSLFNRLTTELPNIFISTLFNAATLGFYSLSYRILTVPSSFIGMSIGQVYMKQATEEKQNTNVAIKTFKSVVKKMIILGLPIFTFLFFFSEWIFAFVFGEEWCIAGKYAQIISPLLFIRFIVSPVSVTLSVFEEQVVSLFLQLGLLISVIISFSVTWLANLKFLDFLYIFVALLVTYYLFFLFILYKAAQGKLSKNNKQ